ncbi:hypothetical protein AGMMS49965_01360 [Bacteroidia bacterium]|nr:hypothetical protein AGMMS49965_01360 [Bacteroidia bacterium]
MKRTMNILCCLMLVACGGKKEEMPVEEAPAVVADAPKEDTGSTPVRIVAPQSGMQGEYILFRGEGSANEWRWEFGETGMVDAREKIVIYQYQNPGTYTILLETDETQYPVRHTIVIEPQFSAYEVVDTLSVICDDIRARLQKIAHHKSFNDNYNYILKTYLCNNPNTPVKINSSKLNDFYSYCQGLFLTGEGKTTIAGVKIEKNAETKCITQLIVIQNDN